MQPFSRRPRPGRFPLIPAAALLLGACQRETAVAPDDLAAPQAAIVDRLLAETPEDVTIQKKTLKICKVGPHPGYVATFDIVETTITTNRTIVRRGTVQVQAGTCKMVINVQKDPMVEVTERLPAGVALDRIEVRVSGLTRPDPHTPWSRFSNAYTQTTNDLELLIGHNAPGVFPDFFDVGGVAVYHNKTVTTPPPPPPPPAGTFLVIDEDGIDNGLRPNFFSDRDVNDDIAEIGVRQQLRYFAANVGKTIDLYTGEVGDEGWFALKEFPFSWVNAGPTTSGVRNLLAPGPGLGSGSDREALLDKIPNVTPLRATGLRMLVGKTVCALVWDSDISINYGPLNGSLKGANLGVVAFTVNSVTPLTQYSSGTLPRVNLTIRDAGPVCGGPLALLTGAPAPKSSSEPYDTGR